MFLSKIFLKSKYRWASISLPFVLNKENVNSFDIPLTSPEEPKHTEKKEESSGFLRVKKIFEKDEFGNLSKEMITAVNTALFATVVGGSLGGLKQSRDKHEFFVNKLNSEIFVTPEEAKNVLTRQLAITFCKGFAYWGIRLAFFNTSLVLLINILAAYNDKLSIWNFIVAGGVTGSIFRIPKGLRAMLSSGFAGAMLGTILGCISVGSIALFDVSYDEIQQWHYNVKQRRHEKFEELRSEAQKMELEEFIRERMEMEKNASLEILKEEKTTEGKS